MRAGHTHHIPKGGEDDSFGTGNRNSIVDTTHWQHADGTPRSMNQVNIAWQDILYTVLINGMGMSTTDLHKFERPITTHFRDFSRHTLRQFRVTIFIHKLHTHLPAPFL